MNNAIEQKAATRQFAEFWRGKGYEKGQTQPFQQARRYCLDLPLSRHPRWIVTYNFAEFDLYDDSFMPSNLRRAHQENDRAVMAAYGLSTKMTESECVAKLFKRYRTLLEAKGDPK